MNSNHLNKNFLKTLKLTEILSYFFVEETTQLNKQKL